MRDLFPGFEEVAAIGVAWPIALVCALIVAEVLARFARVPRIVGYLATGLLVGPAVADWIPPAQASGVPVLVDLGLAILVFEAGYRANPRWLVHNPWLAAMSVAEAGLTFTLVAGALVLCGVPATPACVVGAVAVASSPAAVVQVVREARAAGQVTERLMLLAALDTVFAAVAVEMSLAALHVQSGREGMKVAGAAFYLLLGSVGLAGIAALLVRPLRALLRLAESEAAALLLAMLLLVVYCAQALKLSPLVAAIAFGFLVRRYVEPGLALQRSFGVAGALLVAILFLAVGATLDWRSLAAGGVAAFAIVGARMAAKMMGATLLAAPSDLSPRKGAALGFALTPVSAVGLLLFESVRQAYPAVMAPAFPAFAAAIAVLELAGPLVALFALRFARETAED